MLKSYDPAPMTQSHQALTKVSSLIKIIVKDIKAKIIAMFPPKHAKKMISFKDTRLEWLACVSIIIDRETYMFNHCNIVMDIYQW